MASRLIPIPDDESRAYWEGCHNHKLVLPKCTRCQTVIFYPRAICPECMCEEMEWISLTGKGSIYSFTIVSRGPTADFEGKVPYSLALVELDEGPRMMTNIINIDPSKISIGMRVRCTFEDISEQISLPQFEPDGM